MKRVAVIAIHHPDFPELILHGKRRDSNKWTLPGGSLKKDESPKKAALRELMEETGIALYDAKKWGTRTIKNPKNEEIEISLFICKCPKELHLKVKQDPDKEMYLFKFLNPKLHGNLHVPMKNNILSEYLNDK